MAVRESGREAPPGFAEDVAKAAARGQVGRLGLLGVEAGEYGWKVGGLGLVGTGLARVGGVGAGRVAWGLGIGGEEAEGAGGRTVVFTGHMIDAPGRERERFPARAEGAARAAIREVMLGLAMDGRAAGWVDRPAEAHSNDDEAVVKMGHTTGLVGVAGGACGGDLLFHEVCAELGVGTVLRLTLPVEAFVAESVAAAGEGWVRRFEALVDRLGAAGVEVLGEGLALPEWMGLREDYDVWQRTNLWLVQEAIALAPRQTLVALWDGERGDGPGGTQHLVEAGAKYKMEVVPPIMTGTLLGQIDVRAGSVR